MKNKKILVFIALLWSFCVSAFAQGVIANRSALGTLLGVYRVDESFETPRIQAGGATGGDGPLSSTNSVDLWGPNLMISGITFSATDPIDHTVQWNGNGFRGVASQTLAGAGSLILDFWNPTGAFGVDLKDSNPSRTYNLAGVTVYGADDSTVIYQDNSFNVTDPANGTFFGYEFSGGIGSVVFSTTQAGALFDNFSPYIDNLTFGTTAVPESSTFSLVGFAVGLLSIVHNRRKT